MALDANTSSPMGPGGSARGSAPSGGARGPSSSRGGSRGGRSEGGARTARGGTGAPTKGLGDDAARSVAPADGGSGASGGSPAGGRESGAGKPVGSRLADGAGKRLAKHGANAAAGQVGAASLGDIIGGGINAAATAAGNFWSWLAGTPVGQAVIGIGNLIGQGVSALGGLLGSAGSAIGSGLSALGGLLGSIGSAIGSGVSALGSAIVGLGASIGAALGIGGVAGTAVVASSGALVATAVAALVSGAVNAAAIAQRDGGYTGCEAAVESAQDPADKGGGDADALKLDGERKIFSVMKGLGLTDAEVAGALGNFEVEGGVDQTSVEGISDERYAVGPRKSEAVADIDAYTRGPLSRAYAASGTDYTQNAGYTCSDGTKCCGLGLAQWTGGNGQLLLNLAKQNALVWSTMDYQMAFIMAMGSPATGKGFFDRYRDECKGSSVDECASYFSKNFEGNTSMAQDKRRAAAEGYLDSISGWTSDDAYVAQVMEIAKKLGADATDAATGDALAVCKTSQSYDNASIASAAASFAYPRYEQAVGNKGTDLYQRVHRNILGDGFYESCDRVVATAVRWSGSDDDYPAGPTGTQLSYLESSDKWEKVVSAYDFTPESYAKLRPGDIFCCDGHTFVFTGREVITKRHGDKTDPSYDVVSGSNADGGNDSSPASRSAGCEALSGYSSDSRRYDVFRCVKPDGSQKYADAGSAGN